jgi:nicotinate-nucleotide--dimethylbenzimidazole phosphoribosyltransferase
MPTQTLTATLAAIRPVPAAAIAAAYGRLDQLTKPRRSLGYLEELAARVVAIAGRPRPQLARKRVCVFAGDHGVCAEGVSAYPPAVTGLMVGNFLRGGAAINVLARRAGAEVEVIDIGVATDLGSPAGLLGRNVCRGTRNLAREAAMTAAETERAIQVGIERAAVAADDGVGLLATGEMGIGNSTPAAALFAVLLGIPAAEVTGPGTGLDAAGVARKIAVIERALQLHHNAGREPLAVLAALGGCEIAGICGLCLGGAARGVPVVVDGFISSAGALVAMRLCPAVKDYLFFAHQSAEPGHRLFFASEGLRPLVDLGLRLGEGTGAAIAIQIIEDALAVNNEMATFAEIGITPGA